MQKSKKIGSFVWYENNIMKITDVIGKNLILEDDINIHRKKVKSVKYGDKVEHESKSNIKIRCISNNIAMFVYGNYEYDICHYSHLKKKIKND